MLGLKAEMNPLRSCRTRTSVCGLLLRMCLLLSLLCVCAHIYMQLEALRLQHHRTVTTATDAGSTCCSALKHHRRMSRWKISLEPWAAETPGLQEEADRFLRYISTPQLSCVWTAGSVWHRGSCPNTAVSIRSGWERRTMLWSGY